MNQEEVKIEMNFQEDDLKSLTEMIDNMLKNEKAIEDTKSALKVLEQAQRQLSEVSIPEKMNELGLKEFVTNYGDKVSTRSFYTAYLPTKKSCEKSKELAIHDKDTGSSEVQIAQLTGKIESLSKHIKQFKKDKHSSVGLLRAVNRRKKLLDYLKKNNMESYKAVLTKLNLRK